MGKFMRDTVAQNLEILENRFNVSNKGLTESYGIKLSVATHNSDIVEKFLY